MSFKTPAAIVAQYIHDALKNRGASKICAVWGKDTLDPLKEPYTLFHLDGDGVERELLDIAVDGAGNQIHYALSHNGQFVTNKSGSLVPVDPYFKRDSSSDPVSFALYYISNGVIGNQVSGTLRTAAQMRPIFQASAGDIIIDDGSTQEDLNKLIKKTFANVNEMLAYGKCSAGDMFSTGGTNWQFIGGDDSDLTNFKALGDVIVNDFGLHTDGATSNTSIYDFIVASLPQGTVLKWLPGSYLGSFISEDKGFIVERGDSEFISDSDLEAIFRFGEPVADEYDVVNSELNHLDTRFTVVGASSLFKVGDIGYLWDQAQRPTGGAVNFEAVKIASIALDIITVEGFLASYKGAAGIKFYHSKKQLKDVQINGGKLKPKPTHSVYCDAVLNAERVKVKKVECTNSTGSAFSYRYCYDLEVDDVKPMKPLDVSSGKGYGVQVLGVSQFVINRILGESCRHAYDQDSAYFGTINIIRDMDDKSSPCNLAHNGFTGYITVNDVKTSSEQYPVVAAGTGYGGSPSADKNKHHFRDITISDVKNTVKGKNANIFNVSGAYLQNSVENLALEHIFVRHLDRTTLTESSQSSCVRINGLAYGTVKISNIDADKAGLPIRLENNDSSIRGLDGVVSAKDIRVDECINIAKVAGEFDALFETIRVSGKILGDSLINALGSGGQNPLSVRVRDFYYPTLITKEIVRCSSSGTYGSIEKNARNSANRVILKNGDQVTAEYMQNRSLYCAVRGENGSSTVDVTLEAPQLSGLEVNLVYRDPGRNALKFLADANNRVEFTISDGQFVNLVSVAGQWNIAGRGNT